MRRRMSNILLKRSLFYNRIIYHSMGRIVGKIRKKKKKKSFIF
jgi:hypothetical protein